MLWLLLTGCVDDAAIAEEMERGLATANEAVIASLAAAELFRWAGLPPTTTLRHAEGCGCPCREAPAGSDGSVLLLDYADLGCFPDSDLLPFPLRGHIELTLDADQADAALEDLLLDRRIGIEGDARATELTATTATLDTSLSVGPMATVTAISVEHDGDSVRFEGEVTTPSGRATLEGVRIPLSDVFGRCPVPSEGQIVVHGTDGDVIVRPVGDQQVEADHRDRVSDRVGWCAYTPAFW